MSRSMKSITPIYLSICLFFCLHETIAQYRAIDISLDGIRLNGDASYLSSFGAVESTSNSILEIGYSFGLSPKLALRSSVGYTSRVDKATTNPTFVPFGLGVFERESLEVTIDYMKIAVELLYYYHASHKGVFVKGEVDAVINLKTVRTFSTQDLSLTMSPWNIRESKDFSESVNQIVPVCQLEFGYDFVFRDRFRPYVAVGLAIQPASFLKVSDNQEFISQTISLGVRYAFLPKDGIN